MTVMLHPFTPQPPDEPPQDAPTPSLYVTETAAWEYKVLARDLEAEGLADEEALNHLGAEGWELAALVTHRSTATYIFKRLAS